MEVGQEHKEHIVITPELVAEFAKVSGDYNPIHLDAEYARTTPFQKPIAHGMLSGALLSGIMGTRFPGRGTVLLEQGLKFKRPLFVGDTAHFVLKVIHVRPDKPIVTIACTIFDGNGETTAEGESVVKVAL
jgi:enoyl-CoA hydratase